MKKDGLISNIIFSIGIIIGVFNLSRPVFLFLADFIPIDFISSIAYWWYTLILPPREHHIFTIVSIIIIIIEALYALLMKKNNNLFRSCIYINVIYILLNEFILLHQ